MKSKSSVPSLVLFWEAKEKGFRFAASKSQLGKRKVGTTKNKVTQLTTTLWCCLFVSFQMQARAHLAARIIKKQHEDHDATQQKLPQTVTAVLRDKQYEEYLANRVQASHYSGLVQLYVRMGDSCFQFSRAQAFENFILLVIVVASLLIALETYDELEGNSAIYAFDQIILAIFTLEVILKVLGETLRPWMYFMGSVQTQQ
jgi:hypothetical protein